MWFGQLNCRHNPCASTAHKINCPQKGLQQSITEAEIFFSFEFAHSEKRRCLIVIDFLETCCYLQVLTLGLL